MRFTTLALTDKQQHNIHTKELKKTGFWGSVGAGCLFLARDTGRIMFNHRSKDVQEPGTWGTWGGAIDDKERPKTGLLREVREESGYTGKIKLIELATFHHVETGFKYYNYLAIIEEEFEPDLDWESQGYRWCDFGSWPRRLHPGTKYLLSRSSNKIEECVDEVKRLHIGEKERRSF